MLHQQLIEEQARARVGIAIDEPNGGFVRCSRAGNAERIAALDDQPHLARHEADDPVQGRASASLCVAAMLLLAQLSLRQVHAGKIAAAMCQRNQGVWFADIAQVDADVGLADQ